MKQILGMISLIFCTQLILSQDLIVTTAGDSIHCKISKVKSDYIYFAFKHKNEIRNTLLAVSNIKEHQLNYFQHSEVHLSSIVGHQKYQHFRFAVNGGFGYRTARIADNVPSDFIDYTKKLKLGLQLSSDLSYYFSEPLGLGVKYSYFKTSNSMDNIYMEDGSGNRTFGKMSDDIRLSYLGPQFSTRILNHSKKNALIMNMSIGYLGYSNSNVLIDSYKIKGGTLGILFDFGYDIALSENLSLGFQLSFLNGTLSQYNLSNGVITERIKLESGQYENLSRIDLTVGLRIMK